MLPRAHRVRTPAEFRRVIRTGHRVGGRLLVVHCAVDQAADGPAVGFVVPRSVGSAVVRNQVRRRLRHLSRDRLPAMAPGTSVVVRVLPAAAATSSAELAQALDRGLRKVGATP